MYFYIESECPNDDLQKALNQNIRRINSGVHHALHRKITAGRGPVFLCLEK